MKRRMLRLGAIVGAAAVSALAVSPAFAAAATSQATAQSLELSVLGNAAVSQQLTATNDGSGEVKNDASTLPQLADVLPANNLIGAGVAPQDAGANNDGTSFACAGIAGTGGGVVTVGDSECNIEGQPLDVDLANLDLGNAVIGDAGVLTAALNGLPGIGDLLTLLGVTLDTLVGDISAAIADTPLGELTIGGSLSAIEAQCTATPTAASGGATLVDGGGPVDIGITIPGGTNVPLVSLPVNPPPNTHVLVDLDTVTATIITAVQDELDTALDGALAGLGLGALLETIQDEIITVLVAQLQPLLQPLQDDILDIGLNLQTVGDGGRSIEVTALDLQVLPVLEDFAGASLISGQIGNVTCGPNTAATQNPPGDDPESPDDDLPEVPTVVDSGVAGDGDNTARNVLGATAALMLLAGTAGLMGYRRMLNK